MKKNANSKNKFLYGALILTISSLLAKLLGAFYRVPLMSMLGSTGLGIFQLIFPIYSFFLILISGGMSLGMSKIISLEQQNGGINNKVLLKNAVRLMLIFSSIASLVIFSVSFPLASLQGNSNSFICYFVLIPALIFSSIISVFRGYFQGMENMLPSGISLVIEQGVKLISSLILVKIFIKRSLIFAIFGAFLGISISEFFALLFLILKYLYKKQKSYKVSMQNENEFLEKKTIMTNMQCYKKIIGTTFPIMLNNIIMPLVYALESSFVIWLLSKAHIDNTTSTSLFGLEDGIVGSIINLPTVISTAISTSILPSITSSFNSRKIDECEKKSLSALKITWLIGLPCFIVFLFFSKDIVLFLYGGSLKNTTFSELKVVVDLIRISSLNVLYVSILSVVTAILQAINKSFIPVKNLLFASIIKLFLTFILVTNPQINIYGLVISDVICFAFALIFDLLYLKTQLNIVFDIKNFVIKPICCSMIMLFAILFSKLFFGLFLSNKMLTLMIMLFGAMLYISLLFVTKIIDKNELPFLKKFGKKIQ